MNLQVFVSRVGSAPFCSILKVMTLLCSPSHKCIYDNSNMRTWHAVWTQQIWLNLTHLSFISAARFPKKADILNGVIVSHMTQLSCFSKTRLKKKKEYSDYFCNFATKQKDHSAKPQMLKDGNYTWRFSVICPSLHLAHYLDMYCLKNKENEIHLFFSVTFYMISCNLR